MSTRSGGRANSKITPEVERICKEEKRRVKESGIPKRGKDESKSTRLGKMVRDGGWCESMARKLAWNWSVPDSERPSTDRAGQKYTR